MAWLVLGRRSPAGFGIHSKFSALVANTRLLPWKGVSEEESLQGTARAVWNPVHRSLLSPVPSTQTPGPPVESQRPGLLWGSYVSNTISTHETRTKAPPCPHRRAHTRRHAATRRNTGEGASSRAGRRVVGGAVGPVIALGGSSSPALCTSHTGAGGAPCSGRTRPGHQASPGVSACAGTH